MFFEVLVAFFLEAGFLGIMLFGMKKVGHRVHFFATCMVALGSLGERVLDPVRQLVVAHAGRIRTCCRWQLPASGLAAHHLQPIVSLAHAAYEPGRAAGHCSDHRSGGRMACVARYPQSGRAADVFDGPVGDRHCRALQLLAGDLHGRNTLEHQPQKLAAIEGSWQRPPSRRGRTAAAVRHSRYAGAAQSP
nr:cytochrome ubiquinol oxidase subunit I [Xanthomonas campestris pv. campestris]